MVKAELRSRITDTGKRALLIYKRDQVPGMSSVITAILPYFTHVEVIDVEHQSTEQAHVPHAEIDGRRRRPAVMAPFGIETLAGKTIAKLEDRAGQCCFLCLEEKEVGQYAIQVPCLRPSKPRRLKSRRLSREIDANGNITFKPIPGSEIYEALDPRGRACESDSEIYKRLQENCFQQVGRWKRWVPFYGITDVREVTFHFLGIVERDGRLPIRITPTDINQVQEEADDVMKDCSPIDELNEICTGADHGSTCRFMMEEHRELCRRVRYDRAFKTKDFLAVLNWLKESARTPQLANGRGTLEGMALPSPILETNGPDRVSVPKYQQPYDHISEIRGLQFDIGWDFGKITRIIHLGAAWNVFGLALVWLCVILWRGAKGNWDTALALGQLVAACVTLLFLYAR